MTVSPEAPTDGFQVAVNAQYIKDFSFESPNAPQIFVSMTAAPDIKMSVNVQTRGLAPTNYEVLLTLKLEAKAETKTAFIAEMTYGGVFTVPSMPEEQLKLFLLVEGPRILFPFARAAMANAIRDGGFPYVMIQPVDFMSLYASDKGNISMMPTAGAA